MYREPGLQAPPTPMVACGFPPPVERTDKSTMDRGNKWGVGEETKYHLGFLSATRSRMEILTKENLVRRKTAHCSFRDFHSLTKDNQIFLAEPDSDEKSHRLRGLGDRVEAQS